MRRTVSIFCICVLMGCKNTQDNKITIETVREFTSTTPIEVNVFISNAAFTHQELRGLFGVEKGHYPLIYGIHTRRNDQQLVDGFYVSQNEKEESILKSKSDNPKEFVLFIPIKKIKITPGNDIEYIIGKIIEKH